MFGTKKEPKIEIEEYPLTGVFVVKIDGEYKRAHYITGFIERASDIMYADQFKTRDGAIKLINLYKEQRLKQNVKVEVIT